MTATMALDLNHFLTASAKLCSSDSYVSQSFAEIGGLMERSEYGKTRVSDLLFNINYNITHYLPVLALFALR
jgi:hypothetical protein